jgi:hypothetical protein
MVLGNLGGRGVALRPAGLKPLSATRVLRAPTSTVLPTRTRCTKPAAAARDDIKVCDPPTTNHPRMFVGCQSAGVQYTLYPRQIHSKRMLMLFVFSFRACGRLAGRRFYGDRRWGYSQAVAIFCSIIVDVCD